MSDFIAEVWFGDLLVREYKDSTDLIQDGAVISITPEQCKKLAKWLAGEDIDD